MLVDHTWLASNEMPPITILGSGPAGLSLALQLERHGVDCLILEAGDAYADSETQEAYAGKVVGDTYLGLDYVRLRALGGSSGHWGGMCRALDPVDFQFREDIPHTGWPIGKGDLDPYTAKANEILETTVREDPVKEDGLVSEINFFFSAPVVRFGEKYFDHIRKSERIRLCLRAPLVRLVGGGGGTTAIVVAKPDRSELTLAPRLVVLATGGIENSRLLLWSNAVSDLPVVPEAASLGRYWMEHPHFEVGEARISEELHERAVTAPAGELYFAPTEAAMRKYGILSGSIRLNANYGIDSGVAIDLARKAACAVEPIGRKAWEIMGRTLWCGDGLRMAWEQAPDPGNRIELSKVDRDAFGIPCTELHWKKMPLDYRTPKVILELFARELMASNSGFVRLHQYVIDEGGYSDDDRLAGPHHMGGTRMSETPRYGIVDRNLKVHGNHNTYVVGSSVFPTAGHSNPTFTIVQLALRLGDHLARRMVQ